jgi:hypothetical protein
MASQEQSDLYNFIFYVFLPDGHLLFLLTYFLFKMVFVNSQPAAARFLIKKVNKKIKPKLSPAFTHKAYGHAAILFIPVNRDS